MVLSLYKSLRCADWDRDATHGASHVKLSSASVQISRDLRSVERVQPDAPLPRVRCKGPTPSRVGEPHCFRVSVAILHSMFPVLLATDRRIRKFRVPGRGRRFHF